MSSENLHTNYGYNLICNRLYESTATSTASIENVVNDEEQTNRVITFKDLNWKKHDSNTIKESDNIKAAPINEDSEYYVVATDKANTGFTVLGSIEGPTITDLYNKIAIINAAK